MKTTNVLFISTLLLAGACRNDDPGDSGLGIDSGFTTGDVTSSEVGTLSVTSTSGPDNGLMSHSGSGDSVDSDSDSVSGTADTGTSNVTSVDTSTTDESDSDETVDGSTSVTGSTDTGTTGGCDIDDTHQHGDHGDAPGHCIGYGHHRG